MEGKRLLKQLFEEDRNRQLELLAYPTFANKLSCDHKALLCKYIRLMRFDEYYSNSGKKYLIPLKFLYKWRRNRLGSRLGILVPNNTCDGGLVIWHYGNVIINLHARIGKNCQLHGDNCIGNNGGKDESGAPTIGNNVDVGIGAKIIGNIYIADDVKIGANAVVTHSCYEKGAILIGVPATIKR